MSTNEDELKRMLEDPGLREQVRRNLPAPVPPAAPAARRQVFQPRLLPGMTLLPGTPRPRRSVPGPLRPPAPPPVPAEEEELAPPVGEEEFAPPVGEEFAPPVGEELAPPVEEEREELAPPVEEEAVVGPVRVSGGPSPAPGVGRTERFHCPVCGMMADLARLDNAPYAVDFFVQTYGGPVRSGTVRRHSKTGKTIDRTGNSSGSIAYYPAGTPEEARLVARRLAQIAREIIRHAERGTLTGG